MTPGPGNVFGNLGRLRRDPFGESMRLANAYGGLVRLRLGPYVAFIVSHPDYVRDVLATRVDNYTKNTPPYRILRQFLNEGLLTADGPLWQRQRRLMQPTFHKTRIAEFAGIMAAKAQSLLDRWDGHEGPLALHDAMMHLTLDIVCETLFGVTDIESVPQFVDALEFLNRDAFRRFTARLPLPPWLPTPRDFRVRRARRQVSDFVLSLIAARRKDRGTARADLLSMLMDATDSDTHEGMTDGQLRDEVMILLLAGYETTANALTWTWYLLARHPEVRAQMEAQLDAVLGGRRPTLEDLPRLTWVAAVIQEAMRLYPPAWRFTRRCESADQIGGHSIPAGSIMVILPYVLHRNPAFWDNPEAFEPRRFLEEGRRPAHPFAYLPFGGGRRVCIGNQYALMEAQLVVATLARRVRFNLAPGHRVEELGGVTLVPRNGLVTTIERRACHA